MAFVQQRTSFLGEGLLSAEFIGCEINLRQASHPAHVLVGEPFMTGLRHSFYAQVQIPCCRREYTERQDDTSEVLRGDKDIYIVYLTDRTEYKQ